jgi:pSer/pThr/pTyr-binding forkhead associated (FHA) protein
MVPHLVPPLTNTRQDFAKLGILVGSMIGLGIGVVEGVAVGSPRLLVRGAMIGLLIGAVGGLFGIFAGGIVYNKLLFGKDESQLGGNVLDFTQQVIARAFGWTFLGAFPGLAAGAATLSRRRAMHGLAGGLLGGFVGGFLFDLVGSLVTVPIKGTAMAATSEAIKFESGGPSRAIGITLIGLFTGLFIGLVEEYMKQAWVRVLAGAKEGKDYIISNPLTVLGRDERADVPLFGDPSLAPQQAAIKRENGRHLLLDGGTPLGSVVNGQRMDPQQPQLLRDGDMIQLGQVRLLFREKATATKIGRPVADAPKSAQAPGGLSMPSHLCPFCGAAKDAQGNCLCTVPGGAPSSAPMPAPSYGNTMMDGGFDVGAPAYSPVPAYGTPPGYGAQPSYSGYGATGMNGRGSVLSALDGPYAGQTFPLAPGSVTIGRSPDNGIPMTSDVTISRHHAHISDENGQHVVYDDGSSNGTFVNNVRVSIQPLVPGDIVQFGASRYRYE